MKLNLKIETGDSVLAFLKAFRNEFVTLNASKSEAEFTSEQEEDISVGMKMLTYFKTTALCTSQIVLEFTPLLNDPTEKLVLSASRMTIVTDIELCNGKYFTFKYYFLLLSTSLRNYCA